MIKNFKPAIIALTLSMTLAGCQTTRHNATTGDLETSSAVNGALIGCAVFGIAGVLTHNSKGALIGCGVGGAAGALVGSKLDQQEADLRRELVSTGVQIKRNKDSIKLIVTGDISFDSGSAKLSRSIMPSLISVIHVLNKYPNATLQVDGHTDNTGNHENNHYLSFSRARSVATFLHTHGLAYGRTNIDGFGDSVPLCSNKTKEGRSCNRRVELTMFPH